MNIGLLAVWDGVVEYLDDIVCRMSEVVKSKP
jgi:hypothetical protein